MGNKNLLSQKLEGFPQQYVLLQDPQVNPRYKKGKGQRYICQKAYHMLDQNQQYVQDFIKTIPVGDHIIEFYHAETSDAICGDIQMAYLVYEYLPSNLEEDILKHKRTETKYSEPEIWQMLYAISSMENQLDKNNTCHKDLKPQNILMQQDTIKFAPVGTFPSDLDAYQNYLKTGNATYLAPELMNNKDLNNNQIDYRSNDVYAGGLTLLDAINLDLSYNDLDYQDKQILIHKKIIQGRLEYSKFLMNLIELMVDYDRLNRPSYKNIFLLLQPYTSQIEQKRQFKPNSQEVRTLFEDQNSHIVNLYDREQVKDESQIIEINQGDGIITNNYMNGYNQQNYRASQIDQNQQLNQISNSQQEYSAHQRIKSEQIEQINQQRISQQYNGSQQSNQLVSQQFNQQNTQSFNQTQTQQQNLQQVNKDMQINRTPQSNIPLQRNSTISPNNNQTQHQLNQQNYQVIQQQNPNQWKISQRQSQINQFRQAQVQNQFKQMQLQPMNRQPQQSLRQPYNRTQVQSFVQQQSKSQSPAKAIPIYSQRLQQQYQQQYKPQINVQPFYQQQPQTQQPRVGTSIDILQPTLGQSGMMHQIKNDRQSAYVVSVNRNSNYNQGQIPDSNQQQQPNVPQGPDIQDLNAKIDNALRFARETVNKYNY